jgi:hypothetical protein
MMTKKQADGFINRNEYSGAFTDANGQHVTRGTRVEYRFGARRGMLLEATQDGDAYVMFDDTHLTECVKFINLCKA